MVEMTEDIQAWPAKESSGSVTDWQCDSLGVLLIGEC
jgi:hypothetical protein